MRSLLWFALLLAAPLVRGTAQTSSALEPGLRVRVTAPALGLDRREAVVEALRRDTLVLRTEATIAIPETSLARIEIYGGRHGHPWRGAGIGALSGLVVGGTIGFIACENYTVNTPTGVGNCLDSHEGAQIILLAGLGIGAAGGALLGLGIGALIKTDKGVEHPLDDLQVGLVPQPDGRLVLGITHRF